MRRLTKTLRDGGADSNLARFLGAPSIQLGDSVPCIFHRFFPSPPRGPPGSIRDVAPPLPRYDVQPPVPNPNTTSGASREGGGDGSRIPGRLALDLKADKS